LPVSSCSRDNWRIIGEGNKGKKDVETDAI